MLRKSLPVGLVILSLSISAFAQGTPKTYAEGPFKREIFRRLQGSKTPVMKKFLDICIAIDTGVVILGTRDVEVKKRTEKGINAVVQYLEHENKENAELTSEAQAKARRKVEDYKWPSK